MGEKEIMKVTPLKKFGAYVPGDQFDLPEKAAALLIRAGMLRAADVEPAAPRQKRQYRRRDLQAQA